MRTGTTAKGGRDCGWYIKLTGNFDRILLGNSAIFLSGIHAPALGGAREGEKNSSAAWEKGKVGPLPILKRTGPGRDPAYVR